MNLFHFVVCQAVIMMEVALAAMAVEAGGGCSGGDKAYHTYHTT